MKTILFDFFGVLSTPVYKKVIEKLFPENKHSEWIKKLDVLDVGDLSENELVKQISESTQISEDEVWAEVNAAPIINQELFSFIEENLKDTYTIGLLTNIPRSLLERLIPERLQLFDLVLVSSDLKLIKPSIEIFEVTIRALDCPPSEILFIDDGEKNIEVARSLGLHGIVYTNFSAFLDEMKRFITI